MSELYAHEAFLRSSSDHADPAKPRVFVALRLWRGSSDFGLSVGCGPASAGADVPVAMIPEIIANLEKIQELAEAERKTAEARRVAREAVA
jgi:hypothetical protein